jgi:transposase
MCMANYLKMKQRQQVIALLDLGWTYRRIQTETGVRRETVSRYDRLRRAKAAKVFPGSESSAPTTEPLQTPEHETASANPANVFPGSPSNAAKVFAGSELPARSTAAPYRAAILEKLGHGLSLQRIWQDLVEEYGYGGSYESVKRFARGLERPRRAVGVYHSAPGEEAQVDFFRGAPTLRGETGQWERPWVFRMTLCHSRHGYEEAAWDQKLETFLRLHENAFVDLGGVPQIVRQDNMKAAVVRACLYDPDSNDIYAAFGRHWGFTPLPIRPRNPQENGKEERSGGYVKDNALKGRRFESLQEQNEFLRRWNRTIARLRIHGTTRQQVWTHFLATDQPALRPLASEPFPLFASGMRTVHPDRHIEVQGSFYPMPLSVPEGTRVRVRWDRQMVYVFQEESLVAVHARISAGRYAPRPGASPLEQTSTQCAFAAQLLGRCERVGPSLHQWAEAAIEERGVRAYRLIQGVLRLTRRHPREQLLHAAGHALEHRLFRYKDLQRLAAAALPADPVRALTQEHESIRPMTQYRLEDLL